ncbi:4'-phosphopantetheinyl transferase superfamily protein [Noviherbaspirillum saxi]|uniref:4'-phosphopantetheinyl transferase superfamily protein n=2 Tax=Noviherbaspirillum saxi TaxID=2320863 RepID=A0A3A3FM14_9BURK|nr:4'-phosphopantetheinyl transferase superfamily protein [Noviherbaspirillum saxi]
MQDEALTRAMQCLTSEERQRYASFTRAERRCQYLIGRVLLRHAVSRVTGIHPKLVATVDRRGSGPGLTLPDGVLHPGISISHSRNWIACITGTGISLGLDIEVTDESRDVTALADAAFSGDEAAWIHGQEAHARVSAFYRFWTVKEALIKLWSNSEKRQPLPLLVDDNGGPHSSGAGWHSLTLAYRNLAIAVCSGMALPEVVLVDATSLLA